MIYNYNKPSELLARQKQTGESYWDMIGEPLPKYKGGKSSVNQYANFVRTHRRALWRFLAANNYPTAALDNMIRLMAYESQYGTSNVARKNHNYSGYGYNGKTYTNFKNDEAFYRAYAALIKRMGAITIQDPVKFAKVLKSKGYYEDSFENYSNNLKNMKQADYWINDEIKRNPQFYRNVQMRLSDFDPDEQDIAPADATRVVKPGIVLPDGTVSTNTQPVSMTEPQLQVDEYNSSLPDIIQAYKAILAGLMPLQTLNLENNDTKTEIPMA